MSTFSHQWSSLTLEYLLVRLLQLAGVMALRA